MATARFISDDQGRLFDLACAELHALGYEDGVLLEKHYRYRDWFSREAPPIEIDAACFGRLPVAYDTAVLGIAITNGASGSRLVNSHRALGCPLFFEVDARHINVWSVGATEDATSRTEQLDIEAFPNWIRSNRSALVPTDLLRTKNTKKDQGELFQGSLFAGLIPELEERIAAILEPRLTAAFRVGMETYEKETGNAPSEAALFKLAFWLLTGKVFADRRHHKFRGLGNSPQPDEVLSLVAEHYKEPIGRLLNEATREAVFERIWTQMDFRNLSVEVLSQIWSRTLVTKATRDRLGIHRTPYSIVRYIIDRIPLDPLPEAGEFIIEPCCGSAVFLVAALNKMRDIIGNTMNAVERHKYFKRILRGFEHDPFGIEIAKLCLSLSDYPNANHWQIDPADVLKSTEFQTALGSARVVLCNPPYGKFNAKERHEYGGSIHRPLAILSRSLDSLSSEGAIGFVLPRVFIDGISYKAVRKRIAERFANVELVTLPDKGWEHADQETVIVLATHPNRHQTSKTQIKHRIVRESEWRDFDWFHRVSSEANKCFSGDEAEKSLAIPELENLWHYLRKNQRLGEVSTIHRGIQWNKPLNNPAWKEKLIRTKKFPNSILGIHPDSEPIFSFTPNLKTAWLDTSDEHKENNARDYPWEKPKVVLNAVTKSRGSWRIAAFVERGGLACYQNFTSIWPNDESNVALFAAIINGPVANAFTADHEGKRHNTLETLKSIPLPQIDDSLRSDIDALVTKYIEAVEIAQDSLLTRNGFSAADELLRRIDARILTAYGLGPRQQRLLLDCFNDQKRHVPFKFSNYFPSDPGGYFTLEEFISPKMRASTIGRLRDAPRPPQSVLDALRRASETHSQ